MAGKSYVVAGYLPGYATNKKRGYDIAKAPGDQLTHLIYCFAGFAQNGAVWEATTPEPKDETKNFQKLAALKQTYPSQPASHDQRWRMEPLAAEDRQSIRVRRDRGGSRACVRRSSNPVSTGSSCAIRRFSTASTSTGSFRAPRIMPMSPF
ncbi:MAG: hypothetical protein WBR28_24600 [Mycobacterium sp.]